VGRLRERRRPAGSYTAELSEHPEAWKPLLEKARRGRVTLLYSSHDAEHNNAVALKKLLDAKLR
jgi:uncharacterized protein YeaO (DUF488 family)